MLGTHVWATGLAAAMAANAATANAAFMSFVYAVEGLLLLGNEEDWRECELCEAVCW